ncbi:50S ribosomal protein L3 N(5)-glutamine methyltransferase [Gammaproteobacteria bacterium]|nr:50S ribosomal protein L3 N(5)-glutamine methyltransferase [Gammaproteobacteria bacterium]
MNELHTIRDFIRWAVSKFNEANLYYGHGTTTAIDEAFALILNTIHLPHEITQDMLSANLTKNEKDSLVNVIKKRIEKRLPVPYITNEAWFAGDSYYVDQRVLIPRSPIAELIQNEFQPWINTPVENILDLCTGSGCIAISCAKAFDEAVVDAVDISKDALDVAKINIIRHNIDDKVNTFQSDLFNELPLKKYDLIISNPPYVDAEDMGSLPSEFLHEPALALAAGDDGLTIVLRILKDAKKYLKPNGTLIVEVGNSESALTKKLSKTAFTWIDFENCDGGVFLLTHDQLNHLPDINI